MDMDIPLPEELEWLESNSLLPEDEEEEYIYPDDQDLPESPTPVSGLTVADNETGRKRPSDASSEKASDEKRSRKDTDTENDEDWLRYSPPKNPLEESVPADAVAAAADDVASVAVEENVLSRFASEIDGECISVTGPNGDRVYAKMSRWEMDAAVKKLNVEGPRNGLLVEPVNVLMERVEQEAFTKTLQASSGPVEESICSDTPVVSEQLWVDKYAPKSFSELLSDEQTNREVLLWLKQWDSCVFGSQIRTTTDDVLSALRRHSSLAQQQKSFDGRSSFRKNRGTSANDQFFNQANGLNHRDGSPKSIPELWKRKPLSCDPPEQKVLLLCGAPGLGKTTLAHVAAKHCGYRVVEINASDERSSSTIESRILDVVQMNSVMANSKPNCLVIDEIDGALGEGKGAVEVILKMVNAERNSVAEKGSTTQDAKPGKHSSRKGSKVSTLSRPVICICNDLFAPALRPLRQVAKVHTFAQPTVSRVVNRLKYICNKEGFKASSIALTVLVEHTECDIRSCLNTLQFLNKKKETLNTLEVGSQVVGRKDMSKSVFDVWKEVFQKKKVKRERRSMEGNNDITTDFGLLYSLISNRGDFELTMVGIHENFLQLQYHDPMMQKTVKCLDVLGISDSFFQYTMRTQQMSLYAYQPSIAIAIRSLIAQVGKPNIEWPKSFQRYRAMLMEKKDILKLWHNKISPSISRHLSIESFVEDSVSPLLHILSPSTLRPVLLSEREKGDLAQLVDTMVSYSITYKNLKPEGQTSAQMREAASDASVLSFDPPIGEFVKFKCYHSGHSGLSLAVKQVLVHEVEKQKILRGSIGRSGLLNDGSNSEGQAIPLNESCIAQSAKTNSTTMCVQNKAKDLESASGSKHPMANGSKNSAVGVGVKLKGPGDVKKISRDSSSFFDRFRKSSCRGSQSVDDSKHKTTMSERDSRPLLFKFNEGFTNAVKMPVQIRQLLL